MEFHNFIQEIEGPTYKITPNQNSLLNFIHTNKNCVIYKNRQEGVSTAICLYLLWKLITEPGIKIGLVSEATSEREIFRQTVNMSLSKLESLLKELLGGNTNALFSPSSHNINSTKFPNGSTIYYISVNNKHAGRGIYLDFVYMSEFRDSKQWMDMLICLSPCMTLSNNSKLIITSTEMRNLRDELLNEEIQEYWCGDLFDGKRMVLTEKY